MCVCHVCALTRVHVRIMWGYKKQTLKRNSTSVKGPFSTKECRQFLYCISRMFTRLKTAVLENEEQVAIILYHLWSATICFTSITDDNGHLPCYSLFLVPKHHGFQVCIVCVIPHDLFIRWYYTWLPLCVFTTIIHPEARHSRTVLKYLDVLSLFIRFVESISHFK